MRWLVIAALLVAAPSSVTAQTADNPHLAQARSAKLALRYTEALEHLDRAEQWGRNNSQQMRELYQLGGEIAGGLGMEDTATAYFRKLLALAPDFTLPTGTSPKLTVPFNTARAELQASGGLRASYSFGPGPTVVVIIDADPTALVAGARARTRIGADAAAVYSMAEGRGRGRIEIPVPGATHVDLAVIDQYGNELLTFGRPYTITTTATATPTETDPPPTTAPPGDVPPRSRGAWPYLAGASLVLGATGVYFGLDARSAQAEFDDLRDTSDQHEASRALELEERGDRSSLIANVAFAGAGVAAGVAVYLYVRRDRERPKRETAVAPMVTRDGLGFTALFSF